MTIADAVDLFKEKLRFIYDEAEIRNLCYYTIEHVCNLKRSEIVAGKVKAFSAGEEASIRIISDELITGKPIQYVLGETEFYGLKLRVNSSVLIPRPETEELVDWVLKKVKGEMLKAEGLSLEGRISKSEHVSEERRSNAGEERFRILDIGTGSGCIPITLKKHLPEAEVIGLDISPEALETAMQNAVLNKVEVKFVRGDILAGAKYFERSALSFDLIISNPPYITTKEKAHMHQNVLNYEPEIALLVPDDEPLLFYNRIADFAAKNLKDAGMLFFEINEAYGPEIVSMLQEKGFNEIELRKDIQGKDRMVKARK